MIPKIIKQNKRLRLIKWVSKYWIEKKFLFWRYKLNAFTRNKAEALELYDRYKEKY